MPQQFANHYTFYLIINIRYLLHVSLAGPNANTEERKAAMKAAQEFIKAKNYSSKTQVRFLHVHKNSTGRKIYLRFSFFTSFFFLPILKKNVNICILLLWCNLKKLLSRMCLWVFMCVCACGSTDPGAACRGRDDSL